MSGCRVTGGNEIKKCEGRMPAKRESQRLCNRTTMDYTFVHRWKFGVLLRKTTGPAKHS